MRDLSRLLLFLIPAAAAHRSKIASGSLNMKEPDHPEGVVGSGWSLAQHDTKKLQENTTKIQQNMTKTRQQVQKRAIDCSTLADMEPINGVNFAQVAVQVCNYWPPQFGTFPVADVEGLSGLLGNLFGEDGIWQSIQTLLNANNATYCLRNEATRDTMDISAQSCPVVLGQDTLDEMVVYNTDLDSGSWACNDEGENSCACTRRDLIEEDTLPLVSIASRPDGCQMVHWGTCYGACPRGYRPTWLVGFFRPVCTSVCSESNHPVSCGVGCATSRGACARVIMRQVSEIAIAASKVATFFTTGGAGVILHQTVEQVVRVAEFAVNVLFKVVKLAENIYLRVTREKVELSLVLALYQTLKDAAPEFIGDWVKLQGLIADTTKFFVQLTDAEFGWTTIDLGWLSGIVMRNGQAILQSAFSVTAAFAHKKCEVADDAVAFVVEDAGDDRLDGAWSQDGSLDGKPRYRLIRNRANTQLQWNNWKKNWEIRVYDRTFGRGWWFGWMGLGWRSLYECSRNTPNFPTSGWYKLEGSLPLPQIVSASNGGEPQ